MPWLFFISNDCCGGMQENSFECQFLLLNCHLFVDFKQSLGHRSNPQKSISIAFDSICRTQESEEFEVSKVRKPTSVSRTGNRKPKKHESAGTLFRKSRSRLLQSKPKIRNQEGMRAQKTRFSLRYIHDIWTS